MVREDILGGLRTALARGQTLRQSMMSFYNAGYLKQEIEEAARALQAERNQPLQPQFAQDQSQEAPIFQRTGSTEKDSSEEPKEQLSQTAKLVQPAQQIQPVQQPPQTIQKVSAYGQPQQTQQPQAAKPRGKVIIFILLGLLIILVGGLIAVFFFKEEILSLFE